MEVKHKDLLRWNRTKLMDNISDVKMVLEKMYGKELFSKNEKQQIEAKTTDNDKIGKMLDILPTKGKVAFVKFCNCLIEAEQCEAANILGATSLQAEGPAERGITTQQQETLESTKKMPQTVQKEFQQIKEQWSMFLGKMSEQDQGQTKDEIELPKDWPNEAAVTAPIKVTPCNESQLKKDSSDHVYPMKKRCHGRCLILSNRTFQSLSRRKGTEKDVVRLEELFKQLHFKVITHTDLTAEEIREKVLEEAKHPDHKQAECFVCVICSHGTKEGICGIDTETVSLEEITKCFDGANCKGLQLKPKLFFIQACEGGTEDKPGPNIADCTEEVEQDLSTLLIEPDNTDATDATQQQAPTKADILVACATHPGYVSIRDTRYGTWFLQAVIYIFQKYACQKDIIGLLTRVNYMVGLGKAALKPKGPQNVMQAPRCISSLTKELYFFPGNVSTSD